MFGRGQPASKRGPRRPQAAFLLVLRMLVLLLGTELSGAAHAALDIFKPEVAHASEDCGDEEAGHECPPGCANCHCWHAGLNAPPIESDWGVPVPTLLSTKSGFTPRLEVAPRGADPDSVYRPPRARPFSV